MKLSTKTKSVTLDGKKYTMEFDDEIDSLKSTIKARRRNIAEDNCYIDALEEAISDAKLAFHAGASPSDMYNALTRTEIKTK